MKEFRLTTLVSIIRAFSHSGIDWLLAGAVSTEAISMQIDCVLFLSLDI